MSWYPGSISYDQYLQTQSLKSDITDSIEDAANEIVASNEETQRISEKRSNELNETIELGFQNVTNALESLHADFNYSMGLLIQRADIRNFFLADISNTLRNPREAQVNELYRRACGFIQAELYQDALDLLEEAVEIDNKHFLAHYQLGLLHLYGKTEQENLVDKANKYLLLATNYGKAVVNDSKKQKDLANAFFYASLSYYFQLDSTNADNLLEITQNAIFCCESALQYNPNLSQAYFHLAKYHCLVDDREKLKLTLKQAIHFDYRYIEEIHQKGNKEVFSLCKDSVDELLNETTEELKVFCKKELDEVYATIDKIKEYNIAGTIYEDALKEITTQLEIADKHRDSHSYIEYLKYRSILQTSKKQTEQLLMDVAEYFRTFIKKEEEARLPTLVWSIIGAVGGFIGGLSIGIVIGIILELFGHGGYWVWNLIAIVGILGVIAGIVIGMNLGRLDVKDYENSRKKEKN